MSLQLSKEMTFSPYNSISSKQGSIYTSRQASPKQVYYQNQKEQLQPNDLFMNYSYLEQNNKNIIRYSSNNNMNYNEQSQSQCQYNSQENQQIQSNMDNTRQNNKNESTIVFMDSQYKQDIQQQNFLNSAKARLDFNSHNENYSSSYLINSSKFINNNISSILGPCSNQSNLVLNYDLQSLLDSNCTNPKNENENQSQILQYDQIQQLYPRENQQVYDDSTSKSNYYYKDVSNSDESNQQMYQNLSVNVLQNKEKNPQLYQQNNNHNSQNNLYGQQYFNSHNNNMYGHDNESLLNQNSIHQRSQSIYEQNTNNQNNNFSLRRNSLNQSAQNSSNQVYNQNYFSCFALKNQQNINHQERVFENQNIDYSNSQPQSNLKSNVNSNYSNYNTSNCSSNNKQSITEQNSSQMSQNKKILFSMIVEIPDGRHETIEVCEGACIQDLSYNFCIKNNMEIQKYCLFLTNRLQAAISHYNSYQSPKRDSKVSKQCTPSQQLIKQKYVNNQDSAIFQVTQKGITCTSQSQQKQNHYSNRSQSQHQINNFQTDLLDQQIQILNGLERRVEIIGSNDQKNQQEQKFEQPQKSLIYELDLSDLPDEICYNDYDDQTNAQIISNTCNSFEQKKSLYYNELIIPDNTKQICNIKSINSELTLNPIENLTQKFNEQLNTKNSLFEQQIQSNCQNIEQLKQNIQKSLEQQYNIQQDFNRRRNCYSQYESMGQYSSQEKNAPQQYANNVHELLNQNKHVFKKINQPDIQISSISNNFNHYDILKYQESQESMENKQSTLKNQIQQNYQNINDQVNKNFQYDKYPYQFDDDDNRFSKDSKIKEINVDKTKQNVRRFSCQFTNICPSESISSFEKNEKQINKIKKDISQTEQLNEQYQNIQNISQKQYLKSSLNQQTNSINNILNFKKQNKSIINSQFDEYDAQLISQIKENGKQNNNNIEKSIEEKDKMKINKIIKILPVPYFQKQKTHLDNFNNQKQEKTNISDEITKDSVNQQEKTVRESHLLRQIEESGQNIQQDLYKNYKAKKGIQNLYKFINRQVGNISNNDLQFSTPTNSNQQSTFSFQQQQNINSKQNDNSYIQSTNPFLSKRMSIENKYIDNISDHSQINCNSNNNEFKNSDISIVCDSQNKDQQLNSQRSSFINLSKDDKQQIYSQRQSLQQNKLSSLLSNNKGTFYTNGSISSRSTNRNSICFTSVNQNLTSVKKNLQSVNNLQKSQIQSINKQQSQVKENQPNTTTNVLSARGSLCQSSSTKGYDSIPSTSRTPNRKQQEQQLFSSIQQSDLKSDNIDSIKRTIFSSIMQSNPTQAANDVKQIKINLSPYIQKSKQQYELNDLLNQNNDKTKYNQLKLLLPAMKKQQNNSKQKNNSCSTLRSSKSQSKQNQSELPKKNFFERKDRRSSTSYLEIYDKNKRHSMKEVQMKRNQDQKSNEGRFTNEPQIKQNENEQIGNQPKVGYNQNFKQRIQQIFSALDSDHDGYISFDKIEVRVINDLLLFILTPILIELCNIQRCVNIEEFNCAFLKLYFNLPQQQQDIIMDPKVEIVWMESEKAQRSSNLEYFNFNSPLYQQYIEKKNTIQQASNKAYNWMLDLTNKEFLEFYMSNFKNLVQETTKYLV